MIYRNIQRLRPRRMVSRDAHGEGPARNQCPEAEGIDQSPLDKPWGLTVRKTKNDSG